MGHPAFIQRVNANYRASKPLLGIFAGNAAAGVGVLGLSEIALSGGATTLAEDLPGVLSRASSSVGNQGAKVASWEVAEQAAKEWVGEGAEPIYANHGTGTQIGWKSAGGTKVVRFNNVAKKGYINLITESPVATCM